MNGKNGLCMYEGRYICTYPLRNVYIYIYRERERERDRIDIDIIQIWTDPEGNIRLY